MTSCVFSGHDGRDLVSYGLSSCNTLLPLYYAAWYPSTLTACSYPGSAATSPRVLDCDAILSSSRSHCFNFRCDTFTSPDGFVDRSAVYHSIFRRRRHSTGNGRIELATTTRMAAGPGWNGSDQDLLFQGVLQGSGMLSPFSSLSFFPSPFLLKLIDD